MSQMVLASAAKFGIPRGIELVGIFPYFGIPMLNDVDPDVLASEETEAVAKLHIFHNNAPEVGCFD